MNRTRTNMYTPTETKVFEDSVAWCAKEAGVKFGKVLVKVHCNFFMPTARGVDGDNILKSVLDGLEKGGALDNDRQVKAASYYIEYESDKPRTEVDITPLLIGSHAIYCGGVLTDLVRQNDKLRCKKCGDEVQNWLVT